MANTFKLIEDRCAKVVEVEGVRYLVTMTATERDSINPHATLTVTTETHLQLTQDGQVRVPVRDLAVWQDILADVVGAAAASFTYDLDDLDDSRVGRGWTEEEDQQLKQMWGRREHDAVRAIAKALTRRPGGIRSHLRLLGLLPSEPADSAPPDDDPGGAQQPGEGSGPPGGGGWGSSFRG